MKQSTGDQVVAGAILANCVKEWEESIISPEEILEQFAEYNLSERHLKMLESMSYNTIKSEALMADSEDSVNTLFFLVGKAIKLNMETEDWCKEAKKELIIQRTRMIERMSQQQKLKI